MQRKKKNKLFSKMKIKHYFMLRLTYDDASFYFAANYGWEMKKCKKGDESYEH